MSYGFRAGGNTKVRRQPKMNDDIVSALRRSMAGDDPQSMPRQRGSMPRTGLPAELGHRMPVNLSNGEFEFTPEQIYAIGLHTLAAMRHGDRPGFADGPDQPGVASQFADMIQKNARPVLDVANSGNNIANGLDHLFGGDVKNGLKEVGSGAYDAAKVIAPGLYKAVSPYVDAAKAGANIGTGVGHAMTGDQTQGFKEMASGAYDAMKSLAPDTFKKVDPYVNAAKLGADLAPGIQNIANHKYMTGVGQLMEKAPDLVETFVPGWTKGAKSVLGINPASAAAAGIKAAGQSLQDVDNGYRDHFQNVFDVHNPVQEVLADTGRVAANLGNALTGGYAEKFGNGISSLISGENFFKGLNEPTDREKFLAEQSAKKAAAAR